MNASHDIARSVGSGGVAYTVMNPWSHRIPCLARTTDVNGPPRPSLRAHNNAAQLVRVCISSAVTFLPLHISGSPISKTSICSFSSVALGGLSTPLSAYLLCPPLPSQRPPTPFTIFVRPHSSHSVLGHVSPSNSLSLAPASPHCTRQRSSQSSGVSMHMHRDLASPQLAARSRSSF